MNRSAHGSIKSAATVRLSKSFQSKMDKMSERLYDIVKSGFMIKRAQNKKRFTPVNYKQRWFELTKRTLSYFDVESVEVIELQLTCKCNDKYISSTNNQNSTVFIYHIRHQTGNNV
uniref:PH domain-containing protein n=1 Tax=Glossina morsitans morsitans TaxID=37546 RepID=A0A1B0GCJ7_GLOMM